jgi:acylphosphatase
VAARRWRVSGHVQGVGFRYFVTRAARRLGLQGRVRNLPDGSVEIEVAGDDGLIEQLKEEVRHGPPGSRVRQLAESEVRDPEPWDGFDIDR